MKRPSALRSLRAQAARNRAAIALLCSLLGIPAAQAANGTWTGSTTPLNWDDAANWAGAAVADGADFTADFSAADVSGYTVVNLLSTRTIGNVIFGDSNLATPASWNLNNNGVSTNALNLVGTAPTITVPDLGAGQNVSISVNISGTGSLTKAGAGTLIHYGNKSYTGATNVTGGTFVTTNNLPGGTNATKMPVTIATGSTLEYRAIFGNIQIRPSAISGGGSIIKSGTGTLAFTGEPNQTAGSSTLALAAGSVFDVQAGTVIIGNYNSQSNSLAGNLAALKVAAGATLNCDSTNAVFGSLEGAGTVSAGYFGPRTLTIGGDNTSTTFSGEIKGNANYNANSSPNLIKVGNGALTLTGAVNIRSAFGQDVLTVRGGTISSPSTLNLHTTAPTQIGVIEIGGSGGNGVSFGSNQGDYVVVDQNAGNITTPLLSVGRQGVTTYNLGGSAVVTAFEVRFAETGPFNGTGAVNVNLSGNAQFKVIGEASILMGQYYGRPLTVTQTGGLLAFYSDVAGTTLGGTGGLAFRSANTAVTYNLSGGTLSLPSITRTDAGGGSGGGNGVFNLSGGTLQITSDTFSVPDGTANSLPFFTFNVLEGGASIDPFGLPVTFNVPLRHAGAAAKDGGLTVVGTTGGTLTLSAANTYTGDTVVQTGASLAVASSSQLSFLLGANGVSTQVLGQGTVTLDGTFSIERASADLTNGNSWQLVSNSTLTETYGPSFNVAGFTPSGDVWTLVDGDQTWTFSEATGALTLSVPPALTPYQSWAATAGLDGVSGRDPAPAADPDGDGLSNLLEFALAANPLASSSGTPAVRVLTVGATNHLSITLPVRDGATFSGATSQQSGAVDGVTYTIEGTSDLSAWTAALVEETGAEATALKATLPAPASGWTLRTFRTATALDASSRVYLRVKAE